MLFQLTLKWNLSEKVFSFVKAKTISNFALKLAERSNHLFSVCLMNQFFQTSVLLNSYLCYKKIISQNVSSEAQVKNFFISYTSYVPFLRYSSFCIFNHPMIYQMCDVMMIINSWDRMHFWIHFLNHKLLSHQIWPTGRYN